MVPILKVFRSYRTWNIYHTISEPDGVLETIVLAILEHWQAVHEFPDRTGHDLVVVGLLEEVELCFLVLQDNSREPVIREGVLWFGKEVDAIYILEELDVFGCYLALAGNILVEVLQLSATEGCIDVWHTVVVANVIVTELPTMRNLCLSGDVLCVLALLLVIEEKHTATTSGDGLVAIE